MATALYPGSFDPFHLGHLAVVEQLAPRYDRVVVGALGNPAKAGLFTLDERVALVAASVRHLGNVECASSQRLTVELADEVGADVIVRSMGKEQLAELVMASANRRLGAIDTVFVAPAPGTGHISSTMVRTLVDAGRTADAAALVPPLVADALAARR